MYKTIVTEVSNWMETHYYVTLYKDYKTFWNFPKPFKLFALACIVSITLAVTLGTLIDPAFFSFFIGIALAGIPAAIGSEGESKGYFRPMKRHKGSEKFIGKGSGAKYQLINKLDDVMRLEAVDNFSDRQVLAGEVFNLLKVHAIEGSNVTANDLLEARKKLENIEQKARKQQQEIALAGVSAETPALDMAANIDLS